MKEKKEIDTKSKIDSEKEDAKITAKVDKTKKILGHIGTGVIAVVFILVLIICLGLIVQIFSGKKPSFFGYRFYYILTDSMEPEFLVGDVILSKLTETEEDRMKIKEGDIVTFRSTSLQGQVVTHRVYKKPYQKNGQWYIETKGDNAPAVDKPVLLNNVEAVLVAKSKGLSVIYKAFTSSTGSILLLVIPFALLLISLVIRLVHQIKKPTKKVVVDEEYKQKVINEYLNKDVDDDYKQKVINEYLENQKTSTKHIDDTKDKLETTVIVIEDDKSSKPVDATDNEISKAIGNKTKAESQKPVDTKNKPKKTAAINETKAESKKTTDTTENKSKKPVDKTTDTNEKDSK